MSLNVIVYASAFAPETTKAIRIAQISAFQIIASLRSVVEVPALADKRRGRSYPHRCHRRPPVKFQERQKPHNNEEGNLNEDTRLRCDWIVLRYKPKPSSHGCPHAAQTKGPLGSMTALSRCLRDVRTVERILPDVSSAELSKKHP